MPSQQTAVSQDTAPVAGQQPTGDAISTENTDPFAELKSNHEKLNSLLASLDDDTISKLDAVNKRVDRFVSKKSQELEKAAKRKEEERRKQEQELSRQRFAAQDFVNRIENLPANQRGEIFVQRPELAMQYKQAKDFLSRAGGSSEVELAEKIWQKARGELEKAYGVKLDEAGSLEDVIKMTSEALAEKHAKDLQAQFDKKFEALKTELIGKVQLGSDQPMKGASSGGSTGGKRVYSVSELASMSLEQYRELSQDIDAAAREGRIKE